jgi:Flp pilus assembly protein TadG
MTLSGRPRCHRRGVAATEFALVSLVLMVLILGVWEVARVIEVQQILTNAAREGARQAALGGSDTEVYDAVVEYLKNAGLPTNNVQVSPTAKTTVTCQCGEQVTSVTVTFTLKFEDVRWIHMYLVTDSNTMLTGQSTWALQ